MKHSIIKNTAIMVVMLIAAAVIYNNGVAISEAAGISLKAVDVASAGLALLTIIPSTILRSNIKSTKDE